MVITCNDTQLYLNSTHSKLLAASVAVVFTFLPVPLGPSCLFSLYSAPSSTKKYILKIQTSSQTTWDPCWDPWRAAIGTVGSSTAACVAWSTRRRARQPTSGAHLTLISDFFVSLDFSRRLSWAIFHEQSATLNTHITSCRLKLQPRADPSRFEEVIWVPTHTGKVGGECGKWELEPVSYRLNVQIGRWSRFKTPP